VFVYIWNALYILHGTIAPFSKKYLASKKLWLSDVPSTHKIYLLFLLMQPYYILLGSSFVQSDVLATQLFNGDLYKKAAH